MTTVSYRCSECLDHTISRDYDVSHLTMSCPACGEFARFVHGDVLAKFEAFEESPPEGFGWERLGKLEKFMVAEGLVRRSKTLDDFSVGSADAESESADAESEAGAESAEAETESAD